MEQQLRKEGKSKYDLGRMFLEHAKEWRISMAESSSSNFVNGLLLHGSTVTPHPDYSKAVLEAFVRLFNNGYVYRGKRMVNWCRSAARPFPMK